MRSIVVLALLAACSRPDKALISLGRTSCYGWCPAYTLTIFPNGRVLYDGFDNVMVSGEQVTSITASQVAALEQAFERADFCHWKAPERYFCTDAPSVTVKYAPPSHAECPSVGHYLCGNEPEEIRKLTTLENEIDRVVNIERFIGAESWRFERFMERQQRSDEILEQKLHELGGAK